MSIRRTVAAGLAAVLALLVAAPPGRADSMPGGPPQLAASETGPDLPAAAPPPALTLPPVEVVGTSPLPGTGIDRDKVPSNVQTLSAPDSAVQGPAAVAADLEQRLGSVNFNENLDNQFQPDVQYRGFEASPVVGTPIGVAVYQNGVRLNEPFGDNVSWDLIPDFAVNRISAIPSNPVFGLNALGGAIVIDMKNGFNYQGSELEVDGGSFGRRQLLMQYGKQADGIGAYIGFNLYHDDGFRLLSPANVRQLYADIGAEGDNGSLHLSVTAANNALAGLGPTPIQEVDFARNSVFASPQTFYDKTLMASLNGNYIATDHLSFQSNFYVRSSRRESFAGNITDAQVCDPPNTGTMCLGNGVTPLVDTAGNIVANSFGGALLGENDVSRIDALGLGGSLQGTYAAPVLGHDNHLVVGMSIDHGVVNFTSYNELATIDPSTLVTKGTGIVIDQPDGSLLPINMDTTNSYYGFFATDTFDVTPELSLTVGGRYNIALIHLIDNLGTALDGNSRFSRLNPSAGVTYKIRPGLTAYAGYAEANRTPTAGEISCSDPVRPCSLDNFLSADPPNLKQVIGHTFEGGVRGKFTLADWGPGGTFDWNLGLFRTDLDDDILAVPSAIISTGFFQNVGNTRRQGIEAGLTYKDDKWTVSANYSFIQATFQSPLTLSSPENPAADADGNIQVRPGDHLPGIPEHRLKLNADYAINDKWKVGGNVTIASDQYYFGDQSNQNPQLPGYFVVNLHASYRVTDNIEVYALVDNALDRKYYTYGIFGDVATIPLPGVPNPTDPRFVSVAPPLAAYGGVRMKF